MMIKYTTPLLATVLLALVGCEFFKPSVPEAKAPTAVSGIETNSVKNESMTLTIQTSKRRFIVGENINLTIVAINTGSEPIVFDSKTSALYKVTLYRMESSGWRWVNQYPQDVMNVRKTWTLQPGRRVKYDQIIPVMRDWPMDEAIRLVVELEGAPNLKCPMIVSASVRKQD